MTRDLAEQFLEGRSIVGGNLVSRSIAIGDEYLGQFNRCRRGRRRLISPRTEPAAVTVSCTSSAIAEGTSSPPPSCIGKGAEAICDMTAENASVHSCTKVLTATEGEVVGLFIPFSFQSVRQ